MGRWINVIFKSNNSYEGDFYQNDIHGYGQYKWADGREYSG